MSDEKKNPFMHLLPPAKSSVTQTSQIQVPGGDTLLSAPQTTLTPSDGIPADGLQALAQVNTDSMEPLDKPQLGLTAQAKKRDEELILDSPSAVRELCDRVDALIQKNTMLAGAPLIETRNYVQALMITLRNRPEFDSVLLDQDVHNIMHFIRATAEESLQLREIKTVKKATRAAKKEQDLIGKIDFAAAFNAAMGILPGPKK